MYASNLTPDADTGLGAWTLRDFTQTIQGGGAVLKSGAGRLVLRWHPLPARQIALLRLPRLAVSFAFDAVDDTARRAFMRRFDLFMQRGGG